VRAAKHLTRALVVLQGINPVSVPDSCERQRETTNTFLFFSEQGR
jgi:hypothetical protein